MFGNEESVAGMLDVFSADEICTWIQLEAGDIGNKLRLVDKYCRRPAVENAASLLLTSHFLLIPEAQDFLITNGVAPEQMEPLLATIPAEENPLSLAIEQGDAALLLKLLLSNLVSCRFPQAHITHLGELLSIDEILYAEQGILTRVNQRIATAQRPALTVRLLFSSLILLAPLRDAFSLTAHSVSPELVTKISFKTRSQLNPFCLALTTENNDLLEELLNMDFPVQSLSYLQLRTIRRQLKEYYFQGKGELDFMLMSLLEAKAMELEGDNI